MFDAEHKIVTVGFEMLSAILFIFQGRDFASLPDPLSTIVHFSLLGWWNLKNVQMVIVCLFIREVAHKFAMDGFEKWCAASLPDPLCTVI